MAKVEITCACGTKKMVRQADLDRGWGKSCSKSCAARARKKGKVAAASRKYSNRYRDYNKKCREERRGQLTKEEIHEMADREAGLDYLSECGDK